MKITDLPENERVGGTHLHMNSFARRLDLMQVQKATRKWPMVVWYIAVHTFFDPGPLGPFLFVC